jgi:hypothetical protein
MPKEVWHIFEDEVPRSFGLQDAFYGEKKLTLLGVVKSKLLACLRKGLTRESGCKELMIRDVCRIDSIDVACCLEFEVLAVKDVQLAIPLRSKHPPAAESLKRYVEAAKAREQVYEVERGCPPRARD